MLERPRGKNACGGAGKVLFPEGKSFRKRKKQTGFGSFAGMGGSRRICRRRNMPNRHNEGVKFSRFRKNRNSVRHTLPCGGDDKMRNEGRGAQISRRILGRHGKKRRGHFLGSLRPQRRLLFPVRIFSGKQRVPRLELHSGLFNTRISRYFSKIAAFQKKCAFLF